MRKIFNWFQLFFIPFIRNWNELLTLPAAIFLYVISGPIFLSIDKTAGIYDIGIFQSLFIATIGIFFGHALIWLILKLTSRELYENLDFATEKNDLNRWQKTILSLVYWCVLLLSWVILVNGMS